MIEISLEDAYREACLALGESIVRERLLTKAAAQPQTKPPAPTTP